MIKLKFIIIQLCLFIPFFSSAQSKKYIIKNYHFNEGVLHTDVMDVYQTEDGYMWLATLSGLQRYNGYEFENFLNEEDRTKIAESNRVYHVTPYNEHILLLSTEAGILAFDRQNLEFVNLHIPENVQQVLTHAKMVVNSNRAEVLIANNKGVFLITFNENLHFQSNIHLNKELAYDIKKAPNGQILIVNSSRLLYYDQDSISLKTLKCLGQPINFTAFTLSFYKDKYLNIGGYQKVCQYSISTINDGYIKLTKYWLIDGLKDLSVVCIHQENEDKIWAGTSNGLYLYSGKSFKRLTSVSESITSLFQDKTGGLWVGTFGNGVNLINLSQKHFMTLNPSIISQIKDKNTRSLFTDNKGDIWIGTYHSGLYKVNKNQDKVQNYKFKDGLNSNKIRATIEDKYGNIWVASTNGLNIILENGEIVNFAKLKKDICLFFNKEIYCLAIDGLGNIWAGSWQNGLYKISFKSIDNFDCIKVDKAQNNTELTAQGITSIFADAKNHILYVGTRKGLNELYLNKDGNVENIVQIKCKQNPNSLSSNFILPILKQNDSTLWIGTVGGGLNKITIKGEKKAFKYYTIKDGLPSNDIESLILDKDDNLWIGGRGISKFIPQTSSFVSFNTSDGLVSQSFKPHVVTKDINDNIIFGGTEGINVFKAEDISANSFITQASFLSIEVNGKKKLPQKVNERKYKTTLSSTENNFTLSFSTFYFANQSKTTYKYRINNLSDSTWSLTKEPKIHLTQLPHGTYKIQIMSDNGEGKWGTDFTEMEIEILAPWWVSNTAKIIYFILASICLFISIFLTRRRYKLKGELHLKKMEEEKKKQLNQIRIDFFTNITHEFRTPLSLIIANIQKLQQDFKLGKLEDKTVNHILFSSSQLKNMINELLDFRKSEEGKYKINYQQIDLHNFVQVLSEVFNNLADAKNIIIQKKIFLSETLLYCDIKILERILSNLVSNAIKYTPENGKIELVCTDQKRPKSLYTQSTSIGVYNPDETYVWFVVKDNGIGISQSDLDYIFENYFRGNENQKAENVGYGIGMAIVKNLTLLHKSYIEVFSEKGQGTEILLGIPSSQQTQEIPVNKYISNRYNDFQLENRLQEDIQLIEDNTNLPKLLIVEDNTQLLDFLKEHFNAKYQVITAEDGLQGIEKAKKMLPDIILSDIMMPNSDGLSMLKSLKYDPKTKFIPLIFLSAKDTEEDQILATQLGAISFIQKPFNLTLLEEKIEQQLNYLGELKTHLQSDIYTEARSMADNIEEQNFLDKIIQIVEHNIADQDLNVEFLCQELGVSKTSLYRKVKNATGFSTNEFIRELRMKKSAHLLTTHSYTIYEVMEMVGIQSPSYFSRTFKKSFGKTPTQFIQEYQKV